MKINKIENHIAWWNEISAGVGLVLGYLCFFLFLLFTPETVIEIEVVEPEYMDTQIGKIPEEIIVDSYPTLMDLNKLEETKAIIRKVPQFNADGSPKLKSVIKEFRGLGKPIVESSQVEILIPYLSSPKFNYVVFDDKKGKKFRVLFSPNEYLKGTNIYYQHKAVTFSDNNSADIFAIRTATFFSILSFVLFVLKSRASVFNWFSELIKTRFDSDLSDD